MKKVISLIIVILMILNASPSYGEETVCPGFFVTEYESIPSPEEYPQTLMFPVESYSISEEKAVTLPERYDARDFGKIRFSGIGQGNDGTCWTFASALALETALGGDTDISEQHMRYACSNTGNNKYGYIRSPSEGGNFSMFTSYAAAWRGPVLETDDPYVYGSAVRDYESITAQKKVAFHLQGTIEIPNPLTPASEITEYERNSFLQTVKEYIYKYGCCFSSIFWKIDYYNQSEKAYYCPYYNNPNHAINLIGWDDNYPKENFSVTPPGDGAFIVKNSQGMTGGYMYLSYYDVMAGRNSSVITSVEDKYNYGELYTYDHFEPGAGISANKYAKTTNVYTSRFDGESVRAVGVVTKSKNLNYEVYLSKNCNGNEKDETKYTLLGSGTLEMPGFHTLKLSAPFELGDKGTKFCVRVIYTSSEMITIPLEYKVASIPDTYANPNESFYSTLTRVYDTYSDIVDSNNNPVNANLFVKAYTDASYKVSFKGCEYGTYSINEKAFIPCQDSTAAGLNDEITLNLSQYEYFFVNGKEYSGDDKVTLKITENTEITTEKPINKTVLSNGESLTVKTIQKHGDELILTITTDFKNKHFLFAAGYSGNTLSGLDSKVADGNTDSYTLTIPDKDNAEKIKIIIFDSMESLSTGFEVLEFNT